MKKFLIAVMVTLVVSINQSGNVNAQDTTEITFKIPTTQISRVTGALWGIYRHEIPVNDNGDTLMTPGQWAKEKIRRWAAYQVDRWGEMCRIDSVKAIPKDGDSIIK